MNSEQERKRNLEELIPTGKKELKQARFADVVNTKLPKSWKVSEKGMDAIKESLAMANTKHGLYASVPMLCRAERCPYAEVCPLVEQKTAPEGERCPLEIAMILNKYEQYTEEFQVDESNIVDMNLIKDLIDLDVQIFRAENKMAVDGDFVEEYTVTVTEGGDEINDIRLSKASEYKEKIMTKKHKILELMNSTRKDKAGDKTAIILDPSTYAAQLMQKAQMENSREYIDVDAEEYRDDDE